ncbi:hypothetical protein Tco_0541377 [Tanacetum coccineum]
MFESRRTTIPFPSRLNDYYCDDKKELYRPQFLEANSYGASHIDNSIPRKEKDPGSFTLPCYINNLCFDNSLADLGASVSVMSLSTYLNLGLGELAHIKLMVELADRTVKYPKAIAKNVLVWIGKFVFPVDFIIIDMLEDVKVPLILGRPFLSTTHAKIDMFKRKITLRKYDQIPPKEKSMALLLAEERFVKIKQAVEEEQNQPENIQELLLKLINDLKILIGIQLKQEEQAAKVSSQYWKPPVLYDDDNDDDEESSIRLRDIISELPLLVAIAPDLPITDFLIMEDEHLNTIPETESDKEN